MDVYGFLIEIFSSWSGVGFLFICLCTERWGLEDSTMQWILLSPGCLPLVRWLCLWCLGDGWLFDCGRWGGGRKRRRGDSGAGQAEDEKEGWRESLTQQGRRKNETHTPDNGLCYFMYLPWYDMMRWSSGSIIRQWRLMVMVTAVKRRMKEKFGRIGMKSKEAASLTTLQGFLPSERASTVI